MGADYRGKIIVFDGDSICQARSEEPDSIERGWAYRVGRDNGMMWHNAGIGGGTITAGLYSSFGPRHWVCRSIDAIHAEYPALDYYIFEGGTNDADLLKDEPEKWGTADKNDFGGDYDDTTFCGAFETLIYKAKKYYPDAKLGYIVAPKMGVDDERRARRRRFFDIAVGICEKWGVPYIDLWNISELEPRNKAHFDEALDAEGNKAAGLMYVDGQHLTASGYDAISPAISAFVRSL